MSYATKKFVKPRRTSAKLKSVGLFRPIPRSHCKSLACCGTNGDRLPATYECREGNGRNPRLESSRSCLSHCFRQCTRTIHSAHKSKTLAEHSTARVRTPSVRRQFAAESGRSSEPPPSAACCLPRTVSHQTGAPLAILQTGLVTTATFRPSALSFPLRWDITPTSSRTGRDCLAAHGTASWTDAIRDRTFARFTAHASACFLVRPLSPTTARAVRSHEHSLA